MESILREKIEQKLYQYYQDDKFVVRNINRVNTKPGSVVFRIKIFDEVKGYLDLYAKKYDEKLNSNIHEMMGLKKNHEQILIPRIIDYYDEENVVLLEGVKGNTLSKSLLYYGFSFGMALNAETLLACSRKIGHAIGYLQKLTNRGERKKIGDLDVYLIKEIESDEYFKAALGNDFLKDIRSQVDTLKGLRTNVAQYHGDPSPHNILLKEDQVYLLDFSFQVTVTFLDPALYLVSLELMRSRFAFSLKNTVLKMEDVFLRAYAEITNEKWDDSTWALIKTLTYLHYLLMYWKRKKTIKNSLVASIDRRYLMKQINEYDIQPFQGM